MFRTLKYLFRDPRGPIQMLIEPKRGILTLKSFVVSNWYLDIKHDETMKPSYKKELMWFMDAKMDERYKKD